MTIERREKRSLKRDGREKYKEQTKPPSRRGLGGGGSELQIPKELQAFRQKQLAKGKSPEQIFSALSPRQREVAERIVKNESYTEIATSLCIEEKTVRSTATQLHRRLFGETLKIKRRISQETILHAPTQFSSLSPTQRAIAERVASGQSYQKIADELNLGKRAVRDNVTKIHQILTGERPKQKTATTVYKRRTTNNEKSATHKNTKPQRKIRKGLKEKIRNTLQKTKAPDLLLTQLAPQQRVIAQHIVAGESYEAIATNLGMQISTLRKETSKISRTLDNVDELKLTIENEARQIWGTTE